jgi:hypothetical protein
MNKRILQQESRKIASLQILKRKLHVFFLSFFFSFLLLGTYNQNINSKIARMVITKWQSRKTMPL